MIIKTGVRCCVHGVEEPWAEDDFLFCYECWHVFRTEQDLVHAYNADIQQMVDAGYADPRDFAVATSAEGIYSCPYCIHDF